MDRTWSGAGGDKRWENPDNWTPVGVPAEGDKVSTGTWKEITISESTASLGSLTILGGTKVICSGWDTKLSVETLTVGSYGTLTCADCQTDNGKTNRLWIVCKDLTIQGDGAIDMSAKGFECFKPASDNAIADGRGPGGGKGRGSAGAHGGFGGWSWGYGYATGYNSLPNDDAENPQLPGSSGYSTHWYADGFGGGVVLIEASGEVKVNGAVNANAKNLTTGNNAAGAGGTVNITCASISGSGKITANGGNCGNCASLCGAPGGGGRIAIHYDPTVQTAEQAKSLTISAAPGRPAENSATASFGSAVDQDRFYTYGSTPAGLGTLWFTDDKLLVGLGTKLSGIIVNVPDVLTLDSLDMTSGEVMFQNEGFALNVTGDLTLSSTAAYLQLGGIYPTNRIGSATYFCGMSPVRLTVGGDLKVLDGARLDVRAAMTNGVEAFGAYVTVGGKMEIGADAKVCPVCDPCNLGAVKFAVGSLQVDEDGCFCADARGGAGGHNAPSANSSLLKRTEYGYGPGYGVSGYYWPPNETKSTPGGCGGGYGGRGMFYDVKRTWVQSDPMSQKMRSLSYGDAHWPLLPGSGGGAPASAVGRSAGHGGGLVFVEAQMSIEVNGTITANGMAPITHDLVGHASGAGSGGAICLVSKTFSAGENAVIRANGGAAKNSTYSGAGAGGRIAIWTGEVFEESPNPRRVHYNENEPGAGWEDVTCAVRPAALPGEVVATFPDAWDKSTAAEAGTVWFCRVDPKKGLMLILR